MPRLELSIDVDQSPVDDGDLRVSGTLVGPHGAHPFVGWIGLLALLQQAVSVADAAPGVGER